MDCLVGRNHQFSGLSKIIALHRPDNHTPRKQSLEG